eukprot:Colp12_sorted_trinity150504_noHs@23471
MLWAIVAAFVFAVAKFWLFLKAVRQRLLSTKQKRLNRTKRLTVGLFHPYCNAGGGGERVLWCMIKVLQEARPDVDIVIYTGDNDCTAEQILEHAKACFNIVPTDPVRFIFLKKRYWVEASRYPRLTLIGQSLGSIVLGWEALLAYTPDVFIDTMGYAFTLPLFKYMGGCVVGAYVHYPTISTDMLQRVRSREATFNNTSNISKSYFLSSAKLAYYKVFAYAYGLAGSCVSLAMVNSTWTYNHIKTVWGVPSKTVIVYPPCDIESLSELPLEPRKKWIVSVAQFRPEKDHMLQLRAFAELLKREPAMRADVRLVLVGSCRHAEDRARVAALQQACTELGIAENVDFKVSLPYKELKALLGQAVVGLHTMRDEHFGIGVVDYMAAGAVPLAHNSGGPRYDIVPPEVSPPLGLLATDAGEYATCLQRLLGLPPSERAQWQQRARAHVATRFSEHAFADQLRKALPSLLPQQHGI